MEISGIRTQIPNEQLLLLLLLLLYMSDPKPPPETHLHSSLLQRLYLVIKMSGQFTEFHMSFTFNHRRPIACAALRWSEALSRLYALRISPPWNCCVDMLLRGEVERMYDRFAVDMNIETNGWKQVPKSTYNDDSVNECIEKGNGLHRGRLVRRKHGKTVMPRDSHATLG